MPRALAYTEPDVLRWARESPGYTVEQRHASQHWRAKSAAVSFLG